MKIRLKCNMILGKEFLTKGTIVYSDLLPEHLQTPEIMDGDISLQQGKVLMLTGLIYTSLAGDGINYPITLAAGELVKLEEIPPRQREDLKEGVHYKTTWIEADRSKVLAQVQKEHEKAFSWGTDDVPLRGR